MKRLAKAMVAMGAVSAALIGTTQAAWADIPVQVGWYSYPGFQSTWHCNSTASYALGSGQGWAYVQACEALNGSYFQGLVNVSFSQAHSNVTVTVENDNFYTLWGGRQCSGSISGGERTCFAQTEYPLSNNPGGVFAYVQNLYVDGVGVALDKPTSGPSQVESPTV